jgi:hypothetical protein
MSKSKPPRWLLIDDTRNLVCDKVVRTYAEGQQALQDEKWERVILGENADEAYALLFWALENKRLPPYVQLVMGDLTIKSNMAYTLNRNGYAKLTSEPFTYRET